LFYGLVIGKFLHALTAVASPRLELEDNASVKWSKIQVSFNNVARSVTGTWRRNYVTIKDLLDLASFKSVNRMVVKAIAVETWSCYHSNDGKDGARNHVGTILFSETRTATAKTKKSAKTGQIAVPLRGGRYICHTRGPRVQQVRHAPPSAHKGDSKEGGI
jgi:hypothetical protein